MLECWDETSTCRSLSTLDVKARSWEQSANQRHTTGPQPACPWPSFSFDPNRLLVFARVSRCRTSIFTRVAPLVLPQLQRPSAVHAVLVGERRGLQIAPLFTMSSFALACGIRW